MGAAWSPAGNQADSLSGLPCMLVAYHSSPHPWAFLIMTYFIVSKGASQDQHNIFHAISKIGLDPGKHLYNCQDLQ